MKGFAIAPSPETIQLLDNLQDSNVSVKRRLLNPNWKLKYIEEYGELKKRMIQPVLAVPEADFVRTVSKCILHFFETGITGTLTTFLTGSETSLEEISERQNVYRSAFANCYKQGRTSDGMLELDTIANNFIDHGHDPLINHFCIKPKSVDGKYCFSIHPYDRGAENDCAMLESIFRMNAIFIDAGLPVYLDGFAKNFVEGNTDVQVEILSIDPSMYMKALDISISELLPKAVSLPATIQCLE